jgi:flagellar hook-length control protein FliK
MANIDLQSLISQLSVSTGGQLGAKAPGQASAAGQLFGNILGQQQTLQTGDVVAGKPLPGGKGLPVIDAGSLPGVTPEMVKVAQALVQLAENPQAAGSLPVQELQNQIQQLLQAEGGVASETSLDELSALTNLFMAVDSAPTTPVNTIQGTLGNAKLDVELNDEQLLQTASAMGVDPAVATTVLQATQTIQPAESVATLNVAGSPVNTPLTAAQVLSAANASAETPQPVNPIANQATAQTVVQNSNINQAATASNQPVPNNVAAQVQTSAQEITDDVVINVRQAAQQAAQQGSAAQVASSVSAQEFFQQRAGRQGVVNNVTANAAQTNTDTGLIRLADNLISKLDQVNNPASTQTTTTEATLQAGSQLNGASFKTMAQFGQASTFAGTSVAAPAAEVPVAEGGSRLQTLMQGDTAAQQAARNMQNQLGQQLQRMVRDGQWQANINLNPARLGQIRINMTMEDGVLTTQLLSANQGVRELLEGGMPRLRELLEESGLQLGQFDVGSDAGNQQQFAQQEENNGVVTQVASAEEANTAAASVSQSQHDGDLDTFA